MDGMKINQAKLDMFETMPIPKAVLKNAVPSMIGMLMMLLYNLADTFFIAQTKDDLQVAAVSLAMPVFMIFMGFGTLFGAGGASVISRSLGAGRREYAMKVSAFCMWACVITGVLLAIVLWVFMTPLLKVMGASAETEPFTRSYLTVVAACGPMAVFSGGFQSIIRSEGQATSAMTGVLVGNIVSIVLNPLMILTMGLGITGVAISTVIGNIVSAAIYLLHFFRRKSSLSISPRLFTVKDKVLRNVMAIGVPAALGHLLMSISAAFANGLMSGYGDMAVAALGVSIKLSMIIGTMCVGLAQGAQPLLGYSVGAGNWKRYKGIFKFSITCALALSATITCLCYLFTGEIVGVFLTGGDAFSLGVSFARIIMSTGALFGVFYLISNSIQSIGSAIPTFIISISRQGIVYIPSLFILNVTVGMNGMVWAQPVADVLSTVLAIVLYTIVLRRRMSAT